MPDSIAALPSMIERVEEGDYDRFKTTTLEEAPGIVASDILADPAHKLETDADGNVTTNNPATVLEVVNEQIDIISR